MLSFEFLCVLESLSLLTRKVQGHTQFLELQTVADLLCTGQILISRRAIVILCFMSVVMYVEFGHCW